MSTPQNTPPPGSTGGTAIRIPPAGSSSPTPDPEDDQDQDQGRHPQKVSFVSKAIGFILKHKLMIASVIIAIFVGIPIYTYFSSHRTMKPSDIDAAIMSDREELKRKNAELEKKIRLMKIEAQSASNMVESMMVETDNLLGIIISNNLQKTSRMTQSSASTTNIVGLNSNASTVQSNIKNIDTGTQSQAQVSTGLVTVNDNHGDIKITIKNSDGDGGLGSRRSNGPDIAEDFVRGLLKAEGNELPIQSEKIIPAKGNGVRYYIPEGWTVNYKYYCSENDLEVFLNVTGTREAPVWTRIEETSARNKIESVWIRNLSKRNIRISFNIFPKDAK